MCLLRLFARVSLKYTWKRSLDKDHSFVLGEFHGILIFFLVELGLRGRNEDDEEIKD